MNWQIAYIMSGKPILLEGRTFWEKPYYLYEVIMGLPAMLGNGLRLGLSARSPWGIWDVVLVILRAIFFLLIFNSSLKDKVKGVFGTCFAKTSLVV